MQVTVYQRVTCIFKLKSTYKIFLKAHLKTHAQYENSLLWTWS